MKNQNSSKFPDAIRIPFFSRKISRIFFVILIILIASPLFSATHKLNLEVAQEGGSNECSDHLKFMYRITNYDSVGVSTSNLRIKIWANTSSTINFNGWWNGAAGGSASSISSCGSGSRQANQLIIITLSSGTITSGGGTWGGGKAADIYRDGWVSPFDDSCDDYSRVNATSTFYNDPYFVLEENVSGTWYTVCEYTNSTTEDSNTGIPCGGTSGCATSPIEADKSADPVSVCVGDNVTFCITATNTGSSAETFDIWDTVPSGFTYVGCDNSCSVDTSGANDVVSWTVSSLAASFSVTRCFWASADAVYYYEFNKIMFACLMNQGYELERKYYFINTCRECGRN